MQLALIAMLPLFLLDSGDAALQRRAAKPAPAPTTATITVTDLSGAPIPEARVNLIGALDRSGSTRPDGTVTFDTLRPGTYRIRIEKDGYITLEREIEIRAGQPAPAPSLALTPAPEPPAPPAPESPPPAPPGPVVMLDLPDYLERNFIGGSEPQKISAIGCSGVAASALWQVREPWTDRHHEDADALLYVIGGEGTLAIEGKQVPLEAGVFVQVPRGTTYSVTRRGRNPVILLAALVGPACQ